MRIGFDALRERHAPCPACAGSAKSPGIEPARRDLMKVCGHASCARSWSRSFSAGGAYPARLTLVTMLCRPHRAGGDRTDPSSQGARGAIPLCLSLRFQEGSLEHVHVKRTSLPLGGEMPSSGVTRSSSVGRPGEMPERSAAIRDLVVPRTRLCDLPISPAAYLHGGRSHPR